jgi:hypothetical protein
MNNFSLSWTTGKNAPIVAACYLTFRDNSFREVPSFGGDTIRRFSANCSEMKKMAAHDFENLLQVCFENSFMVCQLIMYAVRYPRF